MKDKTEEKIKEVLERTNYQYYFGIEDLPEIREDSIELFIRHTVSNLLSVFNEEIRQTKAECKEKFKEFLIFIQDKGVSEFVKEQIKWRLEELQKADEMFNSQQVSENGSKNNHTRNVFTADTKGCEKCLCICGHEKEYHTLVGCICKDDENNDCECESFELYELCQECENKQKQVGGK